MSPNSSLLSRGSAAIGTPFNRLIYRIEKFIQNVRITSEKHGDNLDVIEDLHREGTDLLLRADRLPQVGVSGEELEQFEDCYNDLAKLLMELLNKKGTLAKIGQARRSLKMEIPTFSGSHEAYTA